MEPIWCQKSPQLTIVIEGRSKKVRNCGQKSPQLTIVVEGKDQGGQKKEPIWCQKSPLLTIVIEGRSKNGTNLVSKISPTDNCH